MTLLVPASSLIKRNRPAAMPTTSSVLAVVSKNMGHAECSGCLLMHVCVCVFLWKPFSVRLSAFTSAGLKPHFTVLWIGLTAKPQLLLFLGFKAQVEHNWGRAHTDCWAPWLFPRLSFNARALCCALVPRGGKMKKPPNPYFLHKQQALAVSNHEGVARWKSERWKGKHHRISRLQQLAHSLW